METSYYAAYGTARGERYLVRFKDSGRPVVTTALRDARKYGDQETARAAAKRAQQWTRDGRWKVVYKRTAELTDEMRDRIAARRAERKRNG